jgi:hypothetical protein
MSDGSTNPKFAHGASRLNQTVIPVPARMVQAVANRDGANKYGRVNWRTNAPDAITYIGALQRHLDAWAMGEDEADDGTHHLAHIMASCSLLIDAWLVGTLIDNRDKLEPEVRKRIFAYVDAQKDKVDRLFAARQRADDEALIAKVERELSADCRDLRPQTEEEVNRDREYDFALAFIEAMEGKEPANDVEGDLLRQAREVVARREQEVLNEDDGA